jgi:hypothetical protein
MVVARFTSYIPIKLLINYSTGTNRSTSNVDVSPENRRGIRINTQRGDGFDSNVNILFLRHEGIQFKKGLLLPNKLPNDDDK